MGYNLIIMCRMIAFAYRYSKESGWTLLNDKGVSPEQAMGILFLGAQED